MRFKYSAFDKNGKKIKSVIEADNIKEAKAKLEGLVILDIKPVKSIDYSFSSKVSKKDLSKLFSVLGLYLKAAIPLVTAINLTKNQTSNIKLVKFLDYIQKQIKEGKNLSSAMETQKIIKIPRYVISSIQVAQESGKLSLVLIEIAKFLKEEEKIASKTTQALVYPMFIVIVALFLVSFMLTSVVPKIVKVFANMHQDLPPVTKFVIFLSAFLKQNYIVIFLTFFIFILIWVFLYKKVFKFRFFIHSLMLKIPVVKNIILSKELGRFSYLVYVLTSSGVNYVTAVNLSINTIENEQIKTIFKKALEDVLEGKKLSISLLKAGFDFDKSFIQALALGEETSEIDEILKNLSEIYAEENESRINILLSLLEPSLIVIVGAIIGFIVTALLLPMFSMSIIK